MGYLPLVNDNSVKGYIWAVFSPGKVKYCVLSCVKSLAKILLLLLLLNFSVNRQEERHKMSHSGSGSGTARNPAILHVDSLKVCSCDSKSGYNFNNSGPLTFSLTKLRV